MHNEEERDNAVTPEVLVGWHLGTICNHSATKSSEFCIQKVALTPIEQQVITWEKEVLHVQTEL